MVRLIQVCLVFVWIAGVMNYPVGAQAPQIAASAQLADLPQKTLVVVTGAAGEAEFGKEFAESAGRWREFAGKQRWSLVPVGSAEAGDASVGAMADREALKQAIEKAADLPAEAELWIVLIGHGTFAANVAKFNLAGPDVAASELSDWLKPLKAKVVVINCSSSSGPFLTGLAGKNRMVVTATRSGTELNYSRFGNFLSEAISSLAADVDHDQEVSLLEAFLAASSRTERFYREEARLATEHALLDDNGDRIGTGGDFYRGVRPVKQPEPGKQIDGRAASRAILFSSPGAPKLSSAQLAERQRIEEQIDALRAKKSQLAEAEYLTQLEMLCLALAEVYRAVTKE